MLKIILKNMLWPLAMICVILVANLNIVVGFVSPVPIQYNNVPFPVLNKSAIGPDEPIVLEVYRCNTSNEPIVAVTARSIVNVYTGDTESLPSVTTIIPPGCQIYYPLVGPMNATPQLPSGTYKYQAVTSVSTVFRTYHIIWETAIFEYNREKV